MMERLFSHRRGLALAQRLMRDLVAERLFRPLPRARAHLLHYLDGRATDLSVTTRELLDDDRGVRDRVARGVLCAQARGARHGSVVVPQWAFARWDWRLALGSVRMDWRMCDADRVEFRFADRYDWHPEEARCTRWLHQAATALQQCGARPFRVSGIPATIAYTALRATPRFVPCDRLYL